MRPCLSVTLIASRAAISATAFISLKTIDGRYMVGILLSAPSGATPFAAHFSLAFSFVAIAATISSSSCWRSSWSARSHPICHQLMIFCPIMSTRIHTFPFESKTKTFFRRSSCESLSNSDCVKFGIL